MAPPAPPTRPRRPCTALAGRYTPITKPLRSAIRADPMESANVPLRTKSRRRSEVLDLLNTLKELTVPLMCRDGEDVLRRSGTMALCRATPSTSLGLSLLRAGVGEGSAPAAPAGPPPASAPRCGVGVAERSLATTLTRRIVFASCSARSASASLPSKRRRKRHGINRPIGCTKAAGRNPGPMPVKRLRCCLSSGSAQTSISNFAKLHTTPTIHIVTRANTSNGDAWRADVASVGKIATKPRLSTKITTRMTRHTTAVPKNDNHGCCLK
mmetsp:Transcript_118274/g.331264  ORF Transcript_118274/g.331264 Transcript_118274/m.331264 type:complete len:269 (+) Transcript_118274:535-1341(+)